MGGNGDGVTLVIDEIVKAILNGMTVGVNAGSLNDGFGTAS